MWMWRATKVGRLAAPGVPPKAGGHPAHVGRALGRSAALSFSGGYGPGAYLPARGELRQPSRGPSLGAS